MGPHGNCLVYPVTAEKPENKRAMVVKALAAATVSAVVTSLVITAVRDPSELSSGLIVFFFLYGVPIAGVAALTVGLPAHLLLSRFGVTPHPVSWREVLHGAAFALPGGLLAAAIFWRVAVGPSRTSRLPIDK